MFKNIPQSIPSDNGIASQVLTTDGANTYTWSTGAGASIGGTVTGATAGSVFFAGAAGILAQDNAKFFWDDTNDYLGIGTATPDYPLHIVRSNASIHLEDPAGSGYIETPTGILSINANTAGKSIQLKTEAGLRVKLNTAEGFGMFTHLYADGVRNLGSSVDSFIYPFNNLYLDTGAIIGGSLGGSATANPNYNLDLRKGSAGDVYVQWSHVGIGNTSGDGLKIGIDVDGTAYINNQEGRALVFKTANQTAFEIEAGAQKFVYKVSGNEVTGGGTALLGTNSPAVTNSAPYKWLNVRLSDGSEVYIPCWK